MIKKILLSLAILYIILSSTLYFFQDRLIFPSYTVDFNKFEIDNNMEEITIQTEDNKLLHGIYKKGELDTNILIIYFGGNADDPREFTTMYQELEKYDIVTFNYRGYGQSEGNPSEQKLFDDSLYIYDEYAQNKDVIVIGRSLGSGVATYLASQRDTRGVILITPYDSILSIASDKYFFMPIKYLLKHHFESTKYIKNINSPIAIAEVKNDTTVPNIYTQNLINVINHEITHILLSDVTHGDVLNHSDLGLFIDDFIEHSGN